MRPKISRQPELDFQAPTLRLTRAYYARYAQISQTLDETPAIVDAIHRDLERAREASGEAETDARFQYSSDTVLRVLLCQVLEGLSLRAVVIRIDDSPQLRRFVRIDGGPMMDASTLCQFKNAIGPQTWKRVNGQLARHAVEQGSISGEALRMDTTAVETNIHYPTDSSLLWDAYRVLSRLLSQARELIPAELGGARFHPRAVKRIHLEITRKGRKGRSAEILKPPYRRLIDHVEGICARAASAAEALGASVAPRPAPDGAMAAWLAQELEHSGSLAARVIDQARRRVLEGEAVANDDKLFSVFEPHTELLQRGKAGKPIEFGHMIHIEQVAQKFITDYDVFDTKPVEHTLVPAALNRHQKLFGHLPDQLAADRGYYHNMETLEKLEQRIEVVSIAKKGRRTPEQQEREADPLFRLAQAFRAGVEGTISFLKRVLRLSRCLDRGWERFVSTVGATVLAHNLLILSRA